MQSLDVVVDGIKYSLGHVETVFDIRKTLFNVFIIFVNHITADDEVLRDDIKISQIKTQKVQGILDPVKYENYKDKYFRCPDCKKEYLPSLLKCIHTDTCRLKLTRMIKEHKLFFSNIKTIVVSSYNNNCSDNIQNFTISSIDKNLSNSINFSNLELNDGQNLLTKEINPENIDQPIQDQERDSDEKEGILIPEENIHPNPADEKTKLENENKEINQNLCPEETTSDTKEEENESENFFNKNSNFISANYTVIKPRKIVNALDKFKNEFCSQTSLKSRSHSPKTRERSRSQEKYSKPCPNFNKGISIMETSKEEIIQFLQPIFPNVQNMEELSKNHKFSGLFDENDLKAAMIYKNYEVAGINFVDILFLGVKSNERKKGYGSYFINKMLKKHKRLVAWVDNPAFKFYTKLGFKKQMILGYHLQEFIQYFNGSVFCVAGLTNVQIVAIKKAQEDYYHKIVLRKVK